MYHIYCKGVYALSNLNCVILSIKITTAFLSFAKKAYYCVFLLNEWCQEIVNYFMPYVFCSRLQNHFKNCDAFMIVYMQLVTI